MKTTKLFLFAAILSAVCLAPAQPRQTDRSPIDVLEMKSVPDGNFLVNLQRGGTERLLNIHVKAGAARCVSSSDPALKELAGKFELIGNGVFLVALRNREFTASQWWVFRKDGSATVKEVPDRGERQSAVPVSDDSLMRPTTP